MSAGSDSIIGDENGLDAPLSPEDLFGPEILEPCLDEDMHPVLLHKGLAINDDYRTGA